MNDRPMEYPLYRQTSLLHNDANSGIYLGQEILFLVNFAEAASKKLGINCPNFFKMNMPGHTSFACPQL